ncbi:MAG TPA: 50S ribosomal protein L23 [Polyangiaceae bacterium]|nr:50S ribosomal protein L23 [Polyangiaceae bacterium]
MILTPDKIVRRPIALTEKAAQLKASGNQVVFEVAVAANKLEIKDAIEKLFDVKVARVNTLVQRGKMKRMGKGLAKRRNWKKAIVTLQEGSDIQLFTETSE